MVDYTGKGYWGKMIEVDLTNHKIEIIDRHMKYVDQFVGGEELGVRLVWEAEEQNPGFDPLSDDNPVMFIPGPCTGTPIPFASRYQVVNKSALTMPWDNPYDHLVGGIGWAACGGHFGPNLKWTGFDFVRITGHSDTPVMLKVEDNHAELIDAIECWGLDIPGTQEWTKKKYGVQYATSLIGPAAENGVRWGAIHSDTGRAAARGGAAVLGHRKFKGIIAFGTQMTPVARPDLIAEYRRSYYNALWAWEGLEAFRR